MNANAVIKRARIQFGEAAALSVQDVTFQEWVNSAIKELYTHLLPMHLDRADELRPLIDEQTLTLTAGKTEIPNTVDRVIDVIGSDGVSLLRVTPQIIRAIDTNLYYGPVQDVYALRDKDLWVRPTTTATVDIAHLSPPAEVTDFAPGGADLLPLCGILSHWHIALVHLVTAYAYAQEEDVQQAALYRQKFDAMIGKPTGAQVSA